MWTCTQCRALLPDTWNHCPECGTLQKDCIPSWISNHAQVVELPQGGITLINPERVMALSSVVIEDQTYLTA